MTNNQLAKRRILNALADLYFIQRHNEQLTVEQRTAMDHAIAVLEGEYISLGGRAPDGAYEVVKGNLKDASKSLKTIKAERDELATRYASAAKILGSISRILLLIS